MSTPFSSSSVFPSCPSRLSPRAINHHYYRVPAPDPPDRALFAASLPSPQPAKRDSPHASAAYFETPRIDDQHYCPDRGWSRRADDSPESSACWLPRTRPSDLHGAGSVADLEPVYRTNYADAREYQGFSKDGLLDGLGVLSWTSGSRFEGERTAGRRCGLGVQWNENNLVECGRWKDDKFEEACAVPLALIPKGKRLCAAARKAKLAYPTNSALMPDGSYYIGELNLLRPWQPHGQGSTFDSDGFPCVTLLGSADANNVGRWSNGQLHGCATQIRADGERYEGCFKNGLRDGLGVCSWPDDARYEGEFVADKFCGMGTHWNADGSLARCGLWANGALTDERAVPIYVLRADRFLMNHAKVSSMLYPSGHYFVGPINAE